MNTLILCLIPFLLSSHTDSCYEITTVQEIEKNILSKEQKDRFDYDYQLSTNHCYIFKLKDGRIILLPNRLADELKGIIFRDTECFTKFEKMDKYPIENPNRNIYEQHNKTFKVLPSEIKTFQNFLNEKTGLNLIEINKQSASKYFQEIYKKALNKKQFANSKIHHETFVAMGVILGEIFRKEINGRWGLLKYYEMYNPYFEPIIISKEGDIYRVHGMYQGFSGKNIESLYNALNAFGKGENISIHLKLAPESIKIFE